MDQPARDRAAYDPHKPRDPNEDRLQSQTARILLECNFRCPFCFAAWHEEKEKPSDAVMNTAGKDWRAYMDKMRERGYERLTISGGEPTIHPDILPLVRYAKSLGFKSIELQTNASMATADNVRKLKKAGVTDTLVSLHSHREDVFDRITVTEGVYKTVVDGIKLFIAEGVNVMLSHVIIKWNVEDLVDYVRFCKREFPGMREILFFSMQPEARARKNMHIWPHLPRVKENFAAALDECVKLGVGFRVDSQEGYPMCFVTGHEHRVDLHDITDPEGTFGKDLSAFRVIERKKVKLPRCKECFFEPACYGFWEGYFMLFGHDGIEPVARTERLAELFPDLDRERAPDEDSADILRVRKKNQHTWLEGEVLDQFPMPWREGKKAAQEIL
jgi:MoaA/NifB/PqqE/SkfB family radical SAM enzyme